MKKILLAAGLALIATAASAADQQCHRVKFKCSGFEPSWRFSPASGGKIKFYDPESGNGGNPPRVIKACATQLSSSQTSITTGAPLGLAATVTHQSCVEESGKTRAYSISITYTQGVGGSSPHQASGTGCCRK
jgi:hypothetical protein